MMDKLTIKALTPESQDAWDAYVQQAADGLPLHQSGWQAVLQAVYGYETHFLAAWRGSVLTGVMPLFLVRSRLVGTRAMTMPGGLCADDEETAGGLVEAGKEIAGQAGASRLVLQDGRRSWDLGLQTVSDHVYWLVDLSSGADAMWSALDSNMRRQVRLAERNGLEVVIDRSGRLVDAFYDVFHQFTHQAGTPVFGRVFLEEIVATFPGGFNIAVVYHQGQAIGGYFQLEMRDTVYGMWGAALREHLSLRPVYLAMWAIMRDAAEQGFRYLDMGRSPAGSSAARYKGQWGGARHPIFQQETPTRLAGLDRKGPNSRNPTTQIHSARKYQMVMRLWPRLPMAVTGYLGPKLRRHIPFA